MRPKWVGWSGGRCVTCGLQANRCECERPNRPGPCGECNRRPVPSRFVPGEWIDNHSGSCSQNGALQVCERCGHRHVDRDFGQVLACTMGISLDEGREMQRRIVARLEGSLPTTKDVARIDDSEDPR